MSFKTVFYVSLLLKFWTSGFADTPCILPRCLSYDHLMMSPEGKANSGGEWLPIKIQCGFLAEPFLQKFSS